MTMIDEHQGKRLLGLARETIARKLEGLPDITEAVADPPFGEPAATFVTLKINGQLRGCIGNLEPAGTLWESVRTNALNAAFHDTRFMPLTAEELSEVEIDISILTEPEELDYTDSDELVNRLRPGVDGVILLHGRAGATFLPQVWDQVPTTELFLGHLCRKAGLADDCWKRQHPQILVYQVQSFAEEK